MLLYCGRPPKEETLKDCSCCHLSAKISGRFSLLQPSHAVVSSLVPAGAWYESLHVCFPKQTHYNQPKTTTKTAQTPGFCLTQCRCAGMLWQAEQHASSLQQDLVFNKSDQENVSRDRKCQKNLFNQATRPEA